MINFYTQEEFESQMIQLMVAENITMFEAYNRVRDREQKEAQEYQTWLDQQIFDDENHNEFG